MTEQKKVKIFEHLTMITDSNELKWVVDNSRNKENSQWFHGNCDEFNLVCNIEKKKGGDYWIFVSLSTTESGDNSLGSNTDARECAKLLVDSILRQTNYSFTPIGSPFDKMLKETGIACKRDNNIDQLLD